MSAHTVRAAHHEISTRLLRRAAALADVDEMAAFRTALGLPVEDAERAAVLKALDEIGVDLAALPCLRPPPAPTEGSER
jgi:hypothetical protein